MRYFRIPGRDGTADSYRKVGKGKDPEAMGIDPAAAHEVPRMPRDFEHWDEKTGAFVRNEDAASTARRDRGRRRGDWHSDLEARVGALEQEVAALKRAACR